MEDQELREGAEVRWMVVEEVRAIARVVVVHLTTVAVEAAFIIIIIIIIIIINEMESLNKTESTKAEES